MFIRWSLENFNGSEVDLRWVWVSRMIRRLSLLPESSSFRDMWRSRGGDCRTPLMDDPNRAGMYQCLLIVSSIFIIFNQASCTCPTPVIFWLGIKNSIFSLLLGPGNGYEKLNYIHHWSGRCLVLGGFVHGSLWIRNHHLHPHYWTAEGVFRSSLSRPTRCYLAWFIETC